MTQDGMQDILQRLTRLETEIGHLKIQGDRAHQDRMDMTKVVGALDKAVTQLTERLGGMKSLPAEVQKGQKHDAAADAREKAKRDALDLSLRGIGLALAIPGTVGALAALAALAFATGTIGDPGP